VNHTVDEIDPILETLRSEHDKLARKATAWVKARAALLPYVRDMVLLGCDHNYSDRWINFTVAGDKSKFLSLVRLHRRHGFKPDMPDKDATMAQWFLSKDGVDIYVQFTSTVCRRVQVGTTTQQVPVYETKCESFVPTPTEMEELGTEPMLERMLSADP